MEKNEKKQNSLYSVEKTTPLEDKRKDTQKNKLNKKEKVNITLSIAIPLLVIAILLVSFVLLNYTEQNNKNYSLISSTDFQTTTYSDDYKKTSELTEADKNDAYQKNYQETSLSDGSYLKKSAEWTNKQSGEALITINGLQFKEQEAPENTSALYVATLCYQHGLTEDILVENVQTLIKYYDYVDFIAINNSGENGIVDTKRFTSSDEEGDIRSYISQTKDSGMNVPHYINSRILIWKYGR